MEDLIKELKEVLHFKDEIDVGDVVLVVIEESQNAVYGYVTEIEADNSRKDEWWHVSLAFLSIPIQKTTWTLRTPQMTGMEIFTMGGKKRFIKPLQLLDDEQPQIPISKLPTKEKNKEIKGGFLKRLK